MPRTSSRLPKRITLAWGRDELEIDDPIWIAKIVQDIERNGRSDEDGGARLVEPHSRRLERLDAAMGCSRYVAPGAPAKQIGYQAPDHQGSVAVEALKEFLGLELPVALNFTTGWNDRSGCRMSAVDTFFKPSWRNYDWPYDLELCWMFRGYQLYATHQVGTALYRPYRSGDEGHVERRLLNGQWVRWGFDGASTPPAGRHWSSKKRTFILTASGIQRVGQDDSDLEPEYDDSEDDGISDDGVPQSQENI